MKKHILALLLSFLSFNSYAEILHVALDNQFSDMMVLALALPHHQGWIFKDIHRGLNFYDVEFELEFPLPQSRLGIQEYREAFSAGDITYRYVNKIDPKSACIIINPELYKCMSYYTTSNAPFKIIYNSFTDFTIVPKH